MLDKMQILRDSGCDVDGAMNRMLNDENFFLHCVTMALDQPEYAKLGEALEKKDVTAAFEYAHALKGVTANVGLQPLYDVLVKIVEPLRAGNAENLLPEYQQLLEQRDHLSELISDRAD